MTYFRLFFADDNFKFNETGGKFYKRVENTVGKGEIAYYERFLFFFSQGFQKNNIEDTFVCLGKGLLSHKLVCISLRLAIKAPYISVVACLVSDN